MVKWIQKKITESGVQEQINSFYNLVGDQLKVIEKEAPVLEQATVDKKYKVEERVKTIVIAQRDSYLQEVIRFKEEITIPEESYLSSSTSFMESLKKQIEDNSQKVQKSYPATQHLFHKEVEPLFKAVAEINPMIAPVALPEHPPRRARLGLQPDPRARRRRARGY